MKPVVFAREATGLVREVNAGLATFFNASNGPLGIGMVFLVSVGLAFFSGGNILLALVIAMIIVIPEYITYTVLTNVMPRSGGDYVFNSRLLHPALGFTGNFNVAIWQLVGTGTIAVFITQSGLVPSFQVIGSVTGSNGWISLADTLAKPWPTFLIAVAACLLLLYLLIRGTVAILRFNMVVFLGGLVGLALMIIILLSVSRTEFVAAFNSFAGDRIPGNAYDEVISRARGAGFSPGPGSSLFLMWPVIAIAFQSLAAYFWSTYIGGEIRSARSWRVHNFAMFGALLFNGVMLILALALVMRTFGREFLGSAAFLSVQAPEEFPIPGGGAAVVLFTGIASQSKILATLFALSFWLWFWVLLPCFALMAIRGMFAWSFDRLAPAKLADVSERFHTPVTASVIAVALSILFAALAAFQPDKLFVILAATVPGTYGYSVILTGFAAMNFPRRMKALHDSHPISRHKLFGIPIIAVMGFLSVLFAGVAMAAYWYFAQFGMRTLPTLAFVLLFVLGLALYYIAKAIRRRQGIDVTLAFTEIPPE